MVVDAPLMPATATDLLAAQARAQPEAPALFYDRWAIGFAALEREAARVAGGLAALGVQAGDRVALWLPNCPAYLALYFACARLGAIAVAVNTRYRAGEVGDIVGRSGAKVLALWPDFKGIAFLDILAAVDPAALGALEALVLYDTSETPATPLPGTRAIPYSELSAAAPYRADHAAPDAGCTIFTTSGTTKAPKLVLHNQAAIARHAAAVAADFGLTDRAAAALNPLPLCGVFGFAFAMAMLAAGRPTVLQPAFDAEAAVAAMVAHRITHFCASDDMLHRMLEAAAAERPFPDLRMVGYGAFNAALADLPARAEARGVTLIGLWGMSEMQALVARRDPVEPLPDRVVPGGRPISPAITARVRDPASGRLLAPGAAGELEITGPSQMAGYWGDPAASAAALTDDGYVKTGDLARMEPGGGFEFLARIGDVLRLGGFLVSPAEIEDAVQAHPSVDGAQVVELATPAGNRAIAFVTLEPGAAFDEAALAAHAAARLAKFKLPARFIALDAFPTTESANGVKIQRAKLRRMARQALGAGPPTGPPTG